MGLQSPTFQVDTGGKSIHSYWVFSQPIKIQDWRELQKDLLEYVDGDLSIKNPSRVMRLAGCWHISFKSEAKLNSEEEVAKSEVQYNQSSIISESGCTYTYSQLRNLIPSSVPVSSSAHQSIVKSDQKIANVEVNGKKPTLLTDNCSLLTEEVPLYQFLTKDDRNLIDAGAANGTRNSSGAKLARNLIGTSVRLDYLGIRFTGDPYQLFLDYCNRCPSGNGWNEREWQAIWKSAQLNNPTASLTDDALINCAKAWPKKSANSSYTNDHNGHSNGQKPPQTTNGQKLGRKPPQTTNGQVNGQNPPSTNKVNSNGRKPPQTNNGQKPLQDQEIAALVDELINLELSPSKLTAKLNEIAHFTYIPISEVRKLYTERAAELEQVDSRESMAAELEQLRHATQTSLDLSTVIPSALAKPIQKLAHWLNLRPECYCLALLTGISILHETETELVLHRDWDFTVTPNLFAAIVSPSSQKKSPILKAMVTKPLRHLQKKARKEYKEAILQYEIDLAQYEELKRNKNPNALEQQFPDGRPVEPRMKLYYFTNATGEGIINQVAAHPNQGILYLKDELAGVFKSANQYRGGRGSDEEDLLSYYDGTGGTVLRANGTQADLDGLLLGILGSIQPGVLQKLLGDFEDCNGNWARFMFVWQPLAASSMVPDGGKFDLTELIAWLYEELDRTSSSAPKKYALTPDAFKLFCEAYNSLEQRRIDPATTPAMQNVWGKSEGRIGKIAINLHRTEAVFKGEIPSELIERHTIKAAIALTYFSAQQVQAIYTMLGPSDSLPPMLARVLDIAERKGDWITSKDVQSCFNSKNRPRPETIRQWFKELQTLSLGTTEGSGRYLKFLLNNQSGLSGQQVDSKSTALIQEGQGFQDKVDLVDSIGGFPNQKNHRPGETEKSPKKSTKSTLAQNIYPERDSSVDLESTLVHSSPLSEQSSQIQIGSTVKIHWAGSIRDEEIGTVLSIDESGWATVRLHKKSLRRDLQITSAPVVKTSGQEYYLELIE